jgi:RimJ/RimL family protein N-acetyltransferase
MRYYKRLIGERCYLSPCCSEDAQTWATWFNDLEVTIPLGDEAFLPTGLENERETINHFSKNNSHVFDIVTLETDTLIGRCLLFSINQVDRHAMLGILIGEKDHWGNGYGNEATRLLLDHAFNLLNLNNVMLGTFAFNTRAIACYRKVGFKEIGRRRQARIIGGQKYDTIFMDILAEEFESVYVKSILEGATSPSS